MRIDFNEIPARTLPGMNGGTGEMTAKLYMDGERKIIPCRIHAGGSVGLHRHPAGDDVSYVVSGTGCAVCDGVEERLFAGACHVCPKGSEHSIRNTGDGDLVLLTVVTER